MSHHKTGRELHDEHADRRLEHAATERAAREARGQADHRWQQALTVLMMTSNQPSTDFPGCTN